MEYCGGAMSKPKFIYQLMIRCAPELEDEFNKWYNEVHMPLVMKGGMLKAANRYKVTDAIQTDMPTFTTICEFESREIFEKWLASNELAVAKVDREKTMGGKDVVWTSRAFYEPMIHFGE